MQTEFYRQILENSSNTKLRFPQYCERVEKRNSAKKYTIQTQTLSSLYISVPHPSQSQFELYNH
jgi:hypothetical protein